MLLDTADQIERFQEFIESAYNKEIHNAASKGESALVVDFSDLSKFEPSLAKQLLEKPSKTIMVAEAVAKKMNDNFPLRVRFRNLPKCQKVSIRELKAIHLNKFIAIDGGNKAGFRRKAKGCGSKVRVPFMRINNHIAADRKQVQGAFKV
ncbi:MAG: hypothetical protein ABIB71_02330 [Candidatus Woesearchaeota archaeon]